MRWALPLLAATGCSQLFGLDAPVGASADASRDPIIDGAVHMDGNVDGTTGLTCVQKWMSSQGPSFSAPTALALNSPNEEVSPFVTSDGLEIEYSRSGEVYMATRSTTQADFTNANKIGSLSSGSFEGKTFMAPARLRAFFASTRSASVGATDIFRASRNDVNQSFTVDELYLDNIDTTSDESDPHLTDDLLHMYLVVISNANSRIAFSSRATASDSFSAPVVIPELAGSFGGEAGPTLTADERVVVFSSLRSMTSVDLYYATRASATGTFGTPKALATLNTNSSDETPHISEDGCTLYFSSNRNGANGYDIFVTTVL